jgi:hypothetical protein
VGGWVGGWWARCWDGRRAGAGAGASQVASTGVFLGAGEQAGARTCTAGMGTRQAHQGLRVRWQGDGSHGRLEQALGAGQRQAQLRAHPPPAVRHLLLRRGQLSTARQLLASCRRGGGAPLAGVARLVPAHKRDAERLGPQVDLARRRRRHERSQHIRGCSRLRLVGCLMLLLLRCACVALGSVCISGCRRWRLLLLVPALAGLLEELPLLSCSLRGESKGKRRAGEGDQSRRQSSCTIPDSSTCALRRVGAPHLTQCSGVEQVWAAPGDVADRAVCGGEIGGTRGAGPGGAGQAPGWQEGGGGRGCILGRLQCGRCSSCHAQHPQLCCPAGH